MPVALYPNAQAKASKTPPTGPNQWMSAKEGKKTIWFKSQWKSSCRAWKWVNAVSAKAKHASMSKKDRKVIDKKEAASHQTTADANGGKRPTGWTGQYGIVTDAESHPNVVQIYALYKTPQKAADAIVETFQGYIRSLDHDGTEREIFHRDQLVDLLEAEKVGELAVAVTDIETGRIDGRLKEACVLIAKPERNGKVKFETLCDFKEKKKGAGMSDRQMAAYKAALLEAARRGLKVVHHGGKERDICEAFGLDLDGVADQLGIFRFSLGYIGTKCPLPDEPAFPELGMPDAKVRFPLSMAAFCFMILRKSQLHTAKQDCYDQARVLVYMLKALLKMYEAADEI